MRTHQQQSGFTLLEILVVMLLMAIIAGMVGVNLSRDPAAAVREETQRLALLIQTAQEEAILQGSLYAIELAPTAYRFLRLDENGGLKPIDDDLLRPRELPPGVEITRVNVNGADSEDAKNGFIITPMGDLPNFSIELKHDQIRWQVSNHADGSIEPTPIDT